MERKFKTPADLQEKIDGYLKQCEEKQEFPTKGGLALYLKTTRDVLADYEKHEDYSHSIKSVYQIIEDTWVQALHRKTTVAGVIFYLKNAFGKEWRDRQEVDHTSKGAQIMAINYVKPNGANDKTNAKAG